MKPRMGWKDGELRWAVGAPTAKPRRRIDWGAWLPLALALAMAATILRAIFR